MTTASMDLKCAITSGAGTICNLAATIADLGFTRPIVICDAAVLKAVPSVNKAIDSLGDDVKVMEYAGTSEPTYGMLDRALAQLYSEGDIRKFDVWIGIGGGSAMDFTKGLAVLAMNPGPSINYKGFPIGIAAPAPVIAIPTTTGTGSEVIYNASFVDETTRTKMGINHTANYPLAAILDPILPASAPRSVLASSGCDALVHTLESFTSPKATHHTRMFSAHAFQLIINAMPKLLEKNENPALWSDMQWAAAFAMLSLSNTSSGPAGALSYHLGTTFDVPHGVAGAAFIGRVTRINHDRGYHDYADLLPRTGRSREAASAKVVDVIENLLEIAGHQTVLKDFGVSSSDVPGFLEFAQHTKAAFDFNPVQLSVEDIRHLIAE